MFIVFEGIDGSGKSTVAERFASENNIIYTREPTFTSARADSLNLTNLNGTEAEIEFLIDRIQHQDFLKKQKDVVCHRYVWGGLTYCRVFNNSMYNFVKLIYTHKFFIKPDCYIYIDVDPATSKKRGVLQSTEQLQKLKEAYKITRNHIEIGTRIITINGSNPIDEVLKELYSKIGKYYPDLNGKITQTNLLENL